MKLILCGSCYDVFKLDYDLRSCKCGKCSGAYESDGWHAWYMGSAAYPLGIENSSLRKAVVGQRGIRQTNFTAFVFPRNHERFERREE